jgi:hypothetical protein
MRRDYFELEVRGVDWTEDGGDPEQPTLRIDYRGPTAELENRLQGADGLLSADETDVTFRLLDEAASAAIDDVGDESDAVGVLSVADRRTGDFVLELNRTASDLLQFVEAARGYGQSADGEASYRVEIRQEDDPDPVVTYEKTTFLVYDPEGRLLRSESLIPSGVEL